jgi:hypothetical protein
VPFALGSAYQLALALAAFRYRPPQRTGDALRLCVLVPAHDEAGSVAGCVESLLSQDYPGDRYEVVVVADNCSDDTAARAEAAGARVLVRTDPSARGKGQALRWAFDRILVEPDAPDAVVVVDADATADPSFLGALVAPLAAGAGAAQGESLLTEDGTPGSALRAAAFLLVNRVRPAGRAVLGLACHLAGNGMLIRREVLLANPWEAFTSTEDLEYGLMLRRRGIAPRFAGGAILRSPTAPNAAAARQQQLRWEGGKVHLARRWVGPLLAAAVRERRPDLVDAVVELLVPPLGLLAAGAAGGSVAVTAVVLADGAEAWAVVPWVVGLAAIPAYVLLGLRAARAPASATVRLPVAPVFAAQVPLTVFWPGVPEVIW